MQKECIKTQKERHTEVPEVFASAFLLYVALFAFMRSSTRRKNVQEKKRGRRTEYTREHVALVLSAPPPICICFRQNRARCALMPPAYALCSRFVLLSYRSLCMLTSPAALNKFHKSLCVIECITISNEKTKTYLRKRSFSSNTFPSNAV